MKLIVITAVSSFEEDILTLLKKAEIENFTGTDMDGYNTKPVASFSWFSGESEGIPSLMYFSATSNEKATNLVKLVKEFNTNLEDGQRSHIKAIVLPIESHS